MSAGKVSHQARYSAARVVTKSAGWAAPPQGGAKIRQLGMVCHRVRSAAVARKCIALLSGVRISWTVITRSSVAWENNGIPVPQTGLSLVHTINPFGPSPGRVSR